jgi:uncharacterized protein (TIGR04255 family)
MASAPTAPQPGRTLLRRGGGPPGRSATLRSTRPHPQVRLHRKHVTTRRQYKHPPIEEAVCEFRFAGEREWDPLATPAKLRERLARSYPGKVKVQNVLSAKPAKDVQPGPALEMTPGPTRLRFPSEDGKRLVSVAAQLLGVHVLLPYSGWEDFRARIEEALTAYIDVCQPQTFTRVGLRYINRITLKGEDTVPLGDYFRILPTQPEELPSIVSAFVHRAEHLYDDGTKLVLTFASLPPPPPEKNTFLLDLDLIQEPAEPRPITATLATVDDLRQRERIVFEALITDKLRATFDAEPS